MNGRQSGEVTYRNSNFGSREFAIKADVLYKASLHNLTDADLRDDVHYFEHPEVNPDDRAEYLNVSREIEHAEPDQRSELYRRYKNNNSKIDINKYLSPEQKKELGLTD